MKIDRGEVEKMLAACERDRIGPHPGNETLAELCRTWLAVQDAPVVTIGETHDGYEILGVTPEDQEKNWPTDWETRVRLVRDGGE